MWRITLVMQKTALVLLGFYQKEISPLFPARCRFYPTCSEYGRQAIMRYGLWLGVWMLIKRLLRCHPFNPGGFDPVK